MALERLTRSSEVDVVLVDDHSLFTRGLAFLLQAAGDGRIRVVGITGDAGRAATLVRDTRPDLALIDLQMPPPGGLAAIAAVKRSDPEVRVLALSGMVDADAPVAALQAGADGFLPKTAEPDDLLHPLLSMVEGWAVVPTSLLRRLLRERPQAPALPAELDAAQLALWRDLVSGATTADIARRALVSERTAKRLVSDLLRTLGVGNRLQAAVLAGRCGLLEG